MIDNSDTQNIFSSTENLSEGIMFQDLSKQRFSLRNIESQRTWYCSRAVFLTAQSAASVNKKISISRLQTLRTEVICNSRTLSIFWEKSTASESFYAFAKISYLSGKRKIILLLFYSNLWRKTKFFLYVEIKCQRVSRIRDFQGYKLVDIILIYESPPVIGDFIYE